MSRTARQNPGPAHYEQIIDWRTVSQKNITFGNKYKTEKNSNPGPAAYDAMKSHQILTTKPSAAKMGTERR